ncbi:Intradiol ring-cleavage dioxygenase [Amylostereum chailletii]|nr:Intradiol ring-cleavage dioxygenase [Amylostereum chailletii]
MVLISSVVSVAAVVASSFGVATAHPHPKAGSVEAVKLENFNALARRSLGNCQDQLRKRGGVYERAHARREALAHKARRELGISMPRGLFKRDLDTVLNTTHHSDLTGVTQNSDAATLFTGNNSCILAPETTQGPYYVDGEFVRSDIREDQQGVDLYVDVQLIDVTTCEPVPNVFIDFWHANSTGVYAGVVANGNGDSTNENNWNTTFLRGIQETNEDGVAQFLTVFPGHYTSRATHIHILAQENGTQFDNGTYKATDVKHVGQFFFDQDLITEVEATSPYSTNTQTLTTNAEDSIMSDEAATIDPVLEYVLLGEDVSDGIFAWGAMGINVTASYDISSAATLTESGGVENPHSGMGGGPGGPSGTVSGTAPASTASSA